VEAPTQDLLLVDAKVTDLVQKVSINDGSFDNIIDRSNCFNIKFPLHVTVLNTTELELTINEHKDDCDEDDDFDHNDDDCNDCNIEALTQTLTRCGGWEIDKLVYDSVDLDNLYNIYEFNFSEDGTIAVETPTHTARGTWSASGTKKNITVTIDIPELPFCNHDWVLQEMSEYSNTRLDLRVDDTHRLRYNNSCD